MPLSEDEKNTRMRDARITRGLSQQELAALVGATRQTIGLTAICKALGKTLNDLFWKEGE